jgi:type IV secretion system protein TrbL
VACAPWNPAGCASDIAKSVAGDAFSSIAHDFANAADSATNWLWGQIGTATSIHLGGPGFSLDLGIVLAITATVALGLFAIQLISSTLKRDGGGLGRALKGLVVAFIGGSLAIGVTNLLLAAVDSLSAGVVQAATGKSLTAMGHSLLPTGAITSTTSNPAGMTLLSLATLAAVTIVWAALMIRKVLIVVSALFAPLAFAGSLADITAAWTRRWVEVIVALIVSKLVLVIIFVVGLGMLVGGVGQSGTGKTQLATQTVSGVLVLALAGFAPFLALKLVHFSGDQFHHLQTMASTSMAGAKRVAQAPQKVQSLAMGGIGGGAGAGAAAGVGAGAGAAAGVGGAGGSRLAGAGASPAGASPAGASPAGASPAGPSGGFSGLSGGGAPSGSPGPQGALSVPSPRGPPNGTAPASPGGSWGSAERARATTAAATAAAPPAPPPASPQPAHYPSWAGAGSPRGAPQPNEGTAS